MSYKDISLSCSWKWPSVYLGAGFWEDQTKYHFFRAQFSKPFGSLPFMPGNWVSRPLLIKKCCWGFRAYSCTKTPDEVDSKHSFVSVLPIVVVLFYVCRLKMSSKDLFWVVVGSGLSFLHLEAGSFVLKEHRIWWIGFERRFPCFWFRFDVSKWRQK